MLLPLSLPCVTCRPLQVLRSAQRTLGVCVFTITCDEIADALIQAHQRGVRVRVITDDDQVCEQGCERKGVEQGVQSCGRDPQQSSLLLVHVTGCLYMPLIAPIVGRVAVAKFALHGLAVAQAFDEGRYFGQFAVS